MTLSFTCPLLIFLARQDISQLLLFNVLSVAPKNQASSSCGFFGKYHLRSHFRGYHILALPLTSFFQCSPTKPLSRLSYSCNYRLSLSSNAIDQNDKQKTKKRTSAEVVKNTWSKARGFRSVTYHQETTSFSNSHNALMLMIIHSHFSIFWSQKLWTTLAVNRTRISMSYRNE